jgi:drug/metabolite transporter (DMT)-like permease
MIYIDVGKSNLIYNLNPLVVVLLSNCILGESVTKWDVIFCLGAFAGVFIVSDIGSTSVER